MDGLDSLSVTSSYFKLNIPSLKLWITRNFWVWNCKRLTRLSDLTINGLPATGVASVVESASGVINAFTSLLSKNTYTLVNGRKPSASKRIFLARTTGMATLEITLKP